ncbi:hypothetical protein [Morganella morganii]|uniref:hypothetical protein n=1 Tax=Morganella morganii TaxID=582 RepID=UPI003EBBD1DD
MNHALKAGCILLPLISSPALAGNWEVSYREDEMRGTAAKVLALPSSNTREFNFPYAGGTQMGIILRSDDTVLKKGQKAADLKPTEAIVFVTKGQFTCQSYNDCYVSVKFDDKPVEKYKVSKPQDHSSDTFFINNSKKFIKQAETSKKAIIEAVFYNEGSTQFKFDLTDIDKAKE